MEKPALKFDVSMASILKRMFWVYFMGLNGLALSPAPYLPHLEVFNWWDKAQHAIGFGTLAVLAALAYPLVSRYRLAVLLCFSRIVFAISCLSSKFRR
jgi:hypothetical protein